MYRCILLIILAAGITAVPALVGDAHGHGGGGDVAPPVSFAGMSVTVSTQLTPSDITAGDLGSASMAVRFFDQDTDQTLEQVTYRVAIYRDGELLARHLFYDADGNLDVEIRPVVDCDAIDLEDCTKYFGSEHPAAPGALYTQGSQDPVIQGPILDKGGLYNIRVDVEGATSPITLLTSRLSFETFVSVAQEQPFAIQTASAEIPVVIKTYYDDVGNFGFEQADGSISFDMPFDWSPAYVELVPVVHEELQIPKSFDLYSEENGFRGFVNGIEVDRRALILDPYTHEDLNILHFLVYGQELQRINSVLGEENQQSDLMRFVVVPESKVQRSTLGFYLVNPDSGDRTGTNVSVSWDGRYGVGDDIPFEFAFFDDGGNLLKDVRYGYGLYDHRTGDVLAEDIGGDGPNRGISALEGIDFQTLRIPSQGSYRLDVVVFGQGTVGLDFDDAYAGIGSTLVEVEPAVLVPTEKGTLNVGVWIDGSATGNGTRLNIDFINPSTGMTQEHIDYSVTVTKDGSSVFGPIPLTHTSVGKVGIPVDFAEDGAYDVQIDVEGILFRPIPPETATATLSVSRQVLSLLPLVGVISDPPTKSGLDPEKPNGSCLIATAAFGSEMAPQVQHLRELRDGVVMQTESGAAFMAGFNQLYYSFSPGVADLERQHPAFREFVRAAITPMLASLSILNHVPIGSEAEMLVYGTGIILLNAGMYVGLPVTVILKVQRRKAR